MINNPQHLLLHMALTVGTVFSGIGAIEHSLERMGIEHEIKFACDNSNIDWAEKLTKNSKMLDLLKKLESLGIVHPSLPRISKCWNFTCKNDLDATHQYRHVSPKEIAVEMGKKIDDPKVIRKSQRLENISLLCENCCDIGNIDNNLPNLKDVLYEGINGISDPEIKHKVVNDLYEIRGKKPFVEQSYLANYDVPEGHFHKDIQFLDGEIYKDKIDLFVGGSPCQSFSFVGAQKGFEDARGTLFYDFVRLVDEIKPKMFIWENVKAVYSNDNKRTWSVISKCFDELGYTWHHKVLNAKDYGIPQNRQRVFIVGFLKGGQDFKFPEPIKLNRTMQDFLEDNVSGKFFLNTKGVDFVNWDKNHKKQYTQIDGEIMLCQKANQQFNWHGDFVFVEENKGHDAVGEKYFLSQKVKKYVMATGTKTFVTKPETDLEIARPLLATLFKNHRAAVDNYVTTEGRLRMLTPKECLRLMGFCDSFIRVVSDVQLYRQAGNSIVVDILIAIIAESIPCLNHSYDTFANLQARADKIKEIFDQLSERQIQGTNLEEIIASLNF